MVRYNLIYLLWIIFLAFWGSACLSTFGNAEGKYLQAYANESYPYQEPKIIDFFTQDSVRVFDLSKGEIIQTAAYLLKDTLLQIDTNSFRYYPESETRFKIGDDLNRSEIYHPLQNTNLTEFKVIDARLKSTAWQLEFPASNTSNLAYRETFYFQDSICIKKRSYIQEDLVVLEEFEKYCFAIRSYEDFTFLVLSGNEETCDNYFYHVSQLITLKDDKLIMTRPLAYDPEQVVLSSVDFELPNTQDYFNLCQEVLIPEYYYYGVGTRYPGGLQAILRAVNSSYQKPDEVADETGWLRIRFVVNCEGEKGRYKVQGMGPDYQFKSFHPEIVKQLLLFIDQMEGWIPGRHIYGQPGNMDNNKHLTFKLKAGEILEVLP